MANAAPTPTPTVKFERKRSQSQDGLTVFETPDGFFRVLEPNSSGFSVETLTIHGWTDLIFLHESDGVTNHREALQVWLDIQTPTPAPGESSDDR